MARGSPAPLPPRLPGLLQPAAQAGMIGGHQLALPCPPAAVLWNHGYAFLSCCCRATRVSKRCFSWLIPSSPFSKPRCMAFVLTRSRA